MSNQNRVDNNKVILRKMLYLTKKRERSAEAPSPRNSGVLWSDRCDAHNAQVR